MARPLFLVLLLLASSPALAATLQGRVVNGTTGETTSADRVALYDVTKPAGEPVASASDVDGDFVLEGIPDAAAAHFRLEVERDGRVFPQAIPGFDQPIDAYVYETTDDASAVALIRHHVIFTRDPEHLQVTEFMEFDNRTDPPMVISAAARPMRVHLAHDVHGAPTASIWGGGVPVDVPLLPTDGPQVVGLDTELLPGSTRVVVRYLVHEENQAFTWSSQSLVPTEERRVLVNPTDIVVDAEGFIPTDPAIEDYATYAGLATGPGDAWVVNLSGGAAVAAGADDHDHDHDQGTERSAQVGEFSDIVSRPNRLTNSRAQILLGLGGLLVFGTLAVLASNRRAAAAAPGGADPTRVAVSKIADQYVSGKISREEYEREAARLLKGSGSNPKHRAG